MNRIVRVKMFALAFGTVVVAIGAGWFASGGEPPQAPPQPSTKALIDPRPVHHVDELSLGTLHQGADAETQVFVTFEGEETPGMAVQLKPPPFARVKNMRTFKRGGSQRGQTACIVEVALDTANLGDLRGDFTVQLDDRVARVPMSASVVPVVEGRRKILLISSGFGTAGDSKEFYKPWFDLVEGSSLDVSYMEVWGGLNFEGVGPDSVPKELAIYDVIVVDSGASSQISDNGAFFLQQFVKSGKRLVVFASDGITRAILGANQIIAPFGLTMRKVPGVRESGMIEAVDDPLTEGVRKLSFFRPGLITVGPEPGSKILASAPEPNEGYLVVATPTQGEVVVVGASLILSWIGRDAKDSDNIQMMRNLLTVKNLP